MERDEDLDDDALAGRVADLARRTDGVEPAHALDDAVMAAIASSFSRRAAPAAGEPEDALLERAARATDTLEPAPALVEAVMSERIGAAERPRPAPRVRRREAVGDGLTRTGPWAVLLAGVAAAALALLSVQAEQQVAGELVATLDAAEIAP